MNMEYTTDRLLLRVLSPAESEKVLAFYKKNYEYLQPYEPARGEKFLTEFYQRSNLQAEYNAFIKFNYVRFWISLREKPDTLVGTVSFSDFLRGCYEKCSVGYKIDKDYTGFGLATEALAFAIPLIHAKYAVHRMEALVLPDNFASMRVLEKLGFVREGYIRQAARINGQWKDHFLYGCLFDEANNQIRR